MNVWQTSAPTGRLAGLGARLKHALPLMAVLFFASLLGAATGLGLGIFIAVLVTVGVISALMLRDYRIGVVALVVLMPFSDTTLLPRNMFGIAGFNPSTLILLGTAAVYFLRTSFAQGGALRVPGAFIWLYALPIVLAGLLGTMYVKNIHPGFIYEGLANNTEPLSYLRGVVVKPLLFTLYAYLLVAAVRDSKRPELFLIPYVMSLALMALLVFYAAYSSGLGLGGLSDSRNRRALSTIGLHSNELGPLLVTGAVFVMFTQAGLRNALARACCWAAIGLAAVAAVLTFSRAAFLALLIASGFFFFGAKNAVRLMLGVLVLALIVMVLPQEVIDRATQGMQPGATDVKSMSKSDELTAGRVAGIWIPVLSDIAQSPLIGRGSMSMMWSSAIWTGATPQNVTHPHNAYLRLLMDMGVIGLVVVLSGVVLLWRHLRQIAADAQQSPLAQAAARGMSVVLMVFAVVCVTGTSWTPMPIHVFIWGGLGIALGVSVKPQ